MNFLEPDWLYLLTVPFILMPLLAVAGRAKRKKRLEALLGANANSPEAVHLSYGRRFWRLVLLCTALFFIVAACARPSFYSRLLPFEAKGRDLLVLCDVSRSMNAADIAPSRLQHARYLLRQLSAGTKGDRFGLVPFAGNAYLSCPLTSDPVTFNEYVEDLSTDSIPVGGTNLESAFKTALRAFEGSASNNRAVILLTDGEELQGNIKAVTEELRKRKIPVFAVGFGDPVRGAVIPREPGKPELVRDKDGKIVTTKLNEKLMSDLAAATKGLYIRTTATDPGLSQLESAIDALDRQSRGNAKHTQAVEEFPKALAAALAALFFFLLISERKSAAALLLLMPLLMWGAPPQELPAGKKELPPSGAPAAPRSPEELYNQALELQKAGKEGSEELYRKVLLQVPSHSPLRGRCFFNLAAAEQKRSSRNFQQIEQFLKNGRPDEALKAISGSLKLLDGAEELYTASVAGAIPPQKALPSNLTRLAQERKRLEELKKKIEELMKQQQKAQQQTRSAQQQNSRPPQNQQQRQQQQRAIEKAQQESRKLQQQAQEMQQSDMARSAQRASSELQKASEAKKQGDDQKSAQHLENARRELDRQTPSQQQGKEEKNPSGQQKPAPAPENTPQLASPAPAQPKPSDEKRMGAEQMLELMGEDEKKLRSAIKKHMRNNRTQTEKDW